MPKITKRLIISRKEFRLKEEISSLKQKFWGMQCKLDKNLSGETTEKLLKQKIQSPENRRLDLFET